MKLLTFLKNEYYKNLVTNIFFAIGYIIIVLLLFLLFNTFIKETPLQFNVLYNFDAEHYVEIRNNGYTNFNGTKGDERAFFPLFPIIWRYTTLSQIGISIFNYLIFCISQGFLFTELKVKQRNSIVLMSFPSLMFMILPYSEALFYLGSVLLVFGFIKNRFPIVLISFLLISVTRPVYSILLPAYILTLILTESKPKTIVRKSLIVTMISTLGILLVSLIQFSDTGEWFAFIDAQQGAPWFNILQFPDLPFRSWSKFPAMPIDALAFTSGILCLIVLFQMAINKYINNKSISQWNIYIFSMFYLLGISLAVLLFRGGSFHSLNRFVFCTVYIQLFIIFSWRYFKLSLNITQIICLITLAVIWFYFNGFTHLRLILSYLGLAIYTASFIYYNSERPLIRKLSLSYILISSMIVQIYFLHNFFLWKWIA